MKCSFPNQRPGKCDLCPNTLRHGEHNVIEDMVTGQQGKCCDACLKAKVWSLGPCCKKAS